MFGRFIKIFIKDSDDVENPRVRENYGKLTGITGIVLNLILCAAKIITGAVTGAISVLSVATRKPREVLARYNPICRSELLHRWVQRVIVYLLFAGSMVFFASALYNADPYAVYAGITRGWTGLEAGWKDVTSLLVSCGLDGRLPVMLTCGTLIVLAVESGGRNVAKWIRKQNFVLRWTLYYAMGAAILFFAVFGQSAFIYQNY